MAWTQAINLNNLYHIYHVIGDYDQALTYYQHAYERSRKASLLKSMALTERILGELTLYRPEKDFDKAHNYLRNALQKHIELGETLNTALATALLGEVAFKQNDYPKAVALHKAALKVFLEHGFQDGIGRAHYHLGHTYGTMDDLETAIGHFNAAIEIYNRINDSEWRWRSFLGRGLMRERQYQRIKSEPAPAAERDRQLHLVMGDYQHAIDEFESIRRVLYGGAYAQDLFSEVNSRLYETFISLLIEEQDNEKALDLVRRSRSQQIKSNLLLDTGDDAACRHLLIEFVELSHREAELQKRSAKLPASTGANDDIQRRLSESRDNVRDALDQADDLLKRKYPELYAAFSGSADPKALSADAKKIPQGHAILYLIPLQERVAAMIQQSGRPTRIRMSSERSEQIDDKIRRFRRLIQVSRFSKGDPRDPEVLRKSDDYYSKLIQVSLELYDTLLGQVMPLLEGVKTIGLFCSGNLSYLPYAALCREHEGNIRFLVQDYKLYRTNGKVYDRMASKIRWSEARIAAFVNPDANDPAYDLSETQVLAQRLLHQASRRVKVFARDEATKGNLRQHWQTSQILHIGAHGILTARNPYLQLSPKATGRLSACEITGWPRPENLQLIVLSACETPVALTGSGILEPPVDQANLQIAFSSRFKLIGRGLSPGTVYHLG
jgi:CHAT domain-containing protein